MTTRRLTISGSRSEMGLLSDTQDQEPETPPPVWTPAKNDFWKKPSRWQVCMPRLRLLAKILLSMLGFLVIFKVMNTKPPEPLEAPKEPLPPPPEPILTEQEMTDMSIEAAKREDWVWKDFKTHDGLTRGTTHFSTCRVDEENCSQKPPNLIRYDGYKHLQEDPTDIIQCTGPRGLAMNESDEDAIWAYPAIPSGKLESHSLVVQKD